jgi:hypothetical protein
LALAEYRGFIAATQHVLQRQRALLDRRGMPGEQVEKPFLPREKGAKPTQHLTCPLLRKAGQSGLSHNCHKPFSREGARPTAAKPRHPLLCKARKSSELRSAYRERRK